MSAPPTFFTSKKHDGDEESKQHGSAKKAKVDKEEEPLKSNMKLPSAAAPVVPANFDMTDPLAGPDVPDMAVPVAAPPVILDEYDPAKTEFRLVLYNSNNFKNMVSLIAPVLDECEFRVNSSQKFRGLSVQSMDKGRVAMIVARLKFDDVQPSNLTAPIGFCVNIKMFATLVGSIKPGGSLEISRARAKPGQPQGGPVILRGLTQRSSECNVSAPTINKSVECKSINVLDYKHIITIDLQNLRSLVKIAQSGPISADDVMFSISECILPGTNGSEDRRVSDFTVSIEDKNGPTISRRFRSITTWNKQKTNTTIVISNVNEDEDQIDDKTLRMEEKFREKFGAKFLHQFLKAMDRANITLYLSPTKPLVINYPLSGGDESHSYVRFVLAPKYDDDEDDNNNNDDDDNNDDD